MQQQYEVGELIADRYQVQKVLGKGGMGVVYLVKDSLLGDELVALKIMLPRYFSEERHVERFQREVQLTRKVTHENVIRTFDLGCHHELWFYTMEYAEGMTLDALIEDGALPYEPLLRILLGISGGLAAIHGVGIVHRDLKPSNIILTHEGGIKIADFGVARTPSSQLTEAYEALGSAPFMPPEQWLAKDVTTRADIYALGVVAYRMASGVLPFDAESSQEVMYRHLEIPPRPLSELVSDIPRGFVELVNLMLEKEAASRPSALEVTDILTALLEQFELSSEGSEGFEVYINDRFVDSRSFSDALDAPIRAEVHPSTHVSVKEEESESELSWARILPALGWEVGSAFLLCLVLWLILLFPIGNLIEGVCRTLARSGGAFEFIAIVLGFSYLALLLSVPVLAASYSRRGMRQSLKATLGSVGLIGTSLFASGLFYFLRLIIHWHNRHGEFIVQPFLKNIGGSFSFVATHAFEVLQLRIDGTLFSLREIGGESLPVFRAAEGLDLMGLLPFLVVYLGLLGGMFCLPLDSLQLSKRSRRTLYISAFIIVGTWLGEYLFGDLMREFILGNERVIVWGRENSLSSFPRGQLVRSMSLLWALFRWMLVVGVLRLVFLFGNYTPPTSAGKHLSRSVQRVYERNGPRRDNT